MTATFEDALYLELHRFRINLGTPKSLYHSSDEQTRLQTHITSNLMRLHDWPTMYGPPSDTSPVREWLGETLNNYLYIYVQGQAALQDVTADLIRKQNYIQYLMDFMRSHKLVRRSTVRWELEFETEEQAHRREAVWGVPPVKLKKREKGNAPTVAGLQSTSHASPAVRSKSYPTQLLSSRVSTPEERAQHDTGSLGFGPVLSSNIKSTKGKNSKEKSKVSGRLQPPECARHDDVNPAPASPAVSLQQDTLKRSESPQQHDLLTASGRNPYFSAVNSSTYAVSHGMPDNMPIHDSYFALDQAPQQLDYMPPELFAQHSQVTHPWKPSVYEAMIPCQDYEGPHPWMQHGQFGGVYTPTDSYPSGGSSTSLEDGLYVKPATLYDPLQANGHTDGYSSMHSAFGQGLDSLD